MFGKVIDVLKEVFWLKKSRKRKANPKKKATLKKPVVKKKRVVKASLKAKVVRKPKVVATNPKTAPKLREKPQKVVKPLKVKQPLIDPALNEFGEITQYFDRIKVAVLKVNTGSLLIGDRIHIIGKKTKFIQKLWSMQINREDVKVAQKGQEIGFKVDKMVEVGDKVYK